jgi:single-strand DNA-binding protein
MGFDNYFTVTGNLTRDPEQSGNGPVRVSVAVNARKKDKMTGEWVDDPSFFDVVVWEREIGAGLTKGETVTVTGRIKQERWQDQQSGENRSKVVLVANTVAKTIKKPKADAEVDW